jgi:hypothetical protein
MKLTSTCHHCCKPLLARWIAGAQQQTNNDKGLTKVSLLTGNWLLDDLAGSKPLL